MTTLLALTGCRTRPLLSYLKALGLLRVVGADIDPQAKLGWSGDHAELRTALPTEALMSFLLDDYRPAVVLSPWNGGSGFFPKDSTDALERIEAADGERFTDWHRDLATARAELQRLGIEQSPKDDAKRALLLALRARWSDDAIRWLDAAVVLGTEKPQFPALLGSGGNDGRFDISNNYAQSVVDSLLPPAKGQDLRAQWLAAALYDEPTRMQDRSLGHFDRQKSPVNTPQGEADGFANPWDLVLAVEGCLMMSAAATRRAASMPGAVSAPFTATRTAAGYGSAAAGEGGRAELWMPVWDGEATVAEISGVLREGRAQVGRRVARSGLDFARAAGQLGVARGISGFERYVVLERAGQSNLALNAGRIAVRDQPASLELLEDVERWATRIITRYSTGEGPQSLREVARELERAMFDFAAAPDGRSARRLLLAAGAGETALALSASSADGGPRPVSFGHARRWLKLADDGSVEFSLAASLASLRESTPQVASPLPALRDYLHGTTSHDGQRIYTAGRVRPAATQGDPFRALASIHERRHLDAARVDRPQLGLVAAVGCPLGALAALTAPDSALDLRRVIALAKGLSLLRFPPPGATSWPPLSDDGPVTRFPAPAHAVLALTFREAPKVADEPPLAAVLAPRPGWVASLAAGHVKPVLRDALLRLHLAQREPIPTADDLALGAPCGRRLAAALLWPLRDGDWRRLMHTYTTHRSQTGERAGEENRDDRDH